MLNKEKIEKLKNIFKSFIFEVPVLYKTNHVLAAMHCLQNSRAQPFLIHKLIYFDETTPACYYNIMYFKSEKSCFVNTNCRRLV